MEKELKEHEHKGGWGNSPVRFLLGRARANLKEISIGGFGVESGSEFIKKCLVDCSNFCMMAADNINKIWDHKDRY